MKVFINTIPYSGTHFIVSIFEALGFKHSTFNYSFYTVKPFLRINQKRGINWRSAYLIQNVLSYKPKEIPVSVSSPRNITQSTYKNLFKNLNNQEFIIGHVPFSKKAFGNSTTFRGGRINGWKSFLTDEQNKIFESDYY